MKKKLLGVVVTLILLVGISFWLLSLATPSTEAARLRNSLLANVGEPGDFDWLPGNAPSRIKKKQWMRRCRLLKYINN